MMQMQFIPKHDADRAFDAATCIGCGACVASCKTLLRCYLFRLKYRNMHCCQGKIEAADRVLNMVGKWMPKDLGTVLIQVLVKSSVQKESLENIARMNREYLSASLKG
jgi:succinate dehydrogenase / fumarate reductase iron-sulfur subunit